MAARAECVARAWAVPALLLASLWAKLVFASHSLAPGPFPTHTAVLSTTLAVLSLLCMPILWLSARRRTVALLTLNALISTLAIADFIHFRYFGDVTSAEELLHVSQLLSLGESVLSVARPIDALYYADIFAVIAWAAWRRPKLSERRLVAPRSALAALGVVASLAAVGAPSVRLMVLDPEEVFEYATTRREVVGAIGLLPYHA